MNQRGSKRINTYLPVVISYNPLGLVSGVARDICGEGMFVDTGRITLLRNETVVISFSYPVEDKVAVICVEADVCHTHEGGAGLCFRDFIYEPAGQQESRLVLNYH